ncbi:hypothetical protein ABZW49_38965, partial [Nonomuraea wenchangensis]
GAGRPSRPRARRPPAAATRWCGPSARARAGRCGLLHLGEKPGGAFADEERSRSMRELLRAGIPAGRARAYVETGWTGAAVMGCRSATAGRPRTSQGAA